MMKERSEKREQRDIENKNENYWHREPWKVIHEGKRERMREREGGLRTDILRDGQRDGQRLKPKTNEERKCKGFDCSWGVSGSSFL